MKITELMVGDWIRITDDEYDVSFVSRIEQIGPVGKIFCTMPGDTLAYPYDVECVEPILRTPEILEKNGFAKREGPDVVYTLDIDPDTQLSVKLRIIIDSVKIFRQEQNGRQNLLFSWDIEETLYVHTLQHIMKLCGIEQEIKL